VGGVWGVLAVVGPQNDPPGGGGVCGGRPISILIFIHQAGSLVNGWTLCFLSGNYNLWLRLFSNSVIIEENRCSIRCRADCQTIRHKKRKIDD